MESNNKSNEILVIEIELFAKEGKVVPHGCHAFSLTLTKAAFPFATLIWCDIFYKLKVKN